MPSRPFTVLSALEVVLRFSEGCKIRRRAVMSCLGVEGLRVETMGVRGLGGRPVGMILQYQSRLTGLDDSSG